MALEGLTVEEIVDELGIGKPVFVMDTTDGYYGETFAPEAYVGFLAALINKESVEELLVSDPDIFAQDEAAGPFTLAMNTVTKQEVLSIISGFSDREQAVLAMRWNIGDGAENNDWMSLEEVGKCMGIRTELVRQTEAKLFAKLRHNTYANRLLSLVD